MIRHNKYTAEFNFQKHEVWSGFKVYVGLFSAAGHCMKNHRPTVCLQDPILVSGNICLRSPTENCNLKGAFCSTEFLRTLQLIKYLTKHSLIFFLCFADRASQYNLSN